MALILKALLLVSITKDRLLLRALLIMALPLVSTTRGGTTISDVVLMALLVAQLALLMATWPDKGLVGWIRRVASGSD